MRCAPGQAVCVRSSSITAYRGESGNGRRSPAFLYSQFQYNAWSRGRVQTARHDPTTPICPPLPDDLLIALTPSGCTAR
jgi:hypothetical protein